MTEPEDYDEDLFADLYEAEEAPAKPSQPSAPANDSGNFASAQATSADPAVKEDPTTSTAQHANGHNGGVNNQDTNMNGTSWDDGNANDYGKMATDNDDNHGPVGIKEDGKMFIGGLNWETTEKSLKDYFSQFGEVLETTVMRDAATGRSRGFGFLTFKDPKTVNTVMVKEHFLDGKIIDPKRAIPREEQERTSKIFVGGVSQECTEKEFDEFFSQFGRVVDSTLMMDKETGRPRGFGFVTFDGEAPVDACLAQPLSIHGKMIEVKRAQPRGNMREEQEEKKFGRNRDNKFGRGNDSQDGNFSNQGNQGQQGTQATNGMSPAMLAQYWQRMQAYFAQMQSMMAQQASQGMNNPMAMGNMNPQMMQQMMSMQQMGRGQGISPGGTPNPQSPGSMQGMPTGMNPAMMQQMQQMQQMQMQQQASHPGVSPSPNSYSQIGMQGSSNMPGANRPGFNAQEQLIFEQQKYEQQQARRMQQQQYAQQNQQQYGGPTSWEGMYDDVPQPHMPPSGPSRGGGMQSPYGGRNISPAQRGGRGGGGPPVPPQPSNAPANAPTGPKNAGKPGANYRGGGRGSHRSYHPYARNG